MPSPPDFHSTLNSHAIACQGGGSHAAFTAGVLQTLLLEEAAGDYDIIGFSGTSGGALSALLAWYGLLTGGADASVRLLQDLWRDNTAASKSTCRSHRVRPRAKSSSPTRPYESRGS